jgi:pSer/pThr/pTyr-binding forkhead associated (FHA) protein
LPRLIARSGTDVGKEFPLPDGGELKIGRAPGVGITLLDPKVSREHARVFQQATGWIVEDLESRNGTYVNAQRVKKRLLQPGDRLRTGQTEFEYSPAAAGTPIPASSAAAPAAARPASGAPTAQGIPALRSTRKPGSPPRA